MHWTPAYSNSNGQVHSCPYHAAHSHSNPDSCGYSDIHTRARRCIQSHTDPHPHSYAGPNTYTNTNTNTNTNTYIYT